jgi:hypothetical protein
MGTMGDVSSPRIRPDAIAWKLIDGEAVVLDIERSEYVELNSAATCLLEAIDDGMTPEAMAGRLVERFEVDAERALADTRTFIGYCRDRGWLEG